MRAFTAASRLPHNFIGDCGTTELGNGKVVILLAIIWSGMIQELKAARWVEASQPRVINEKDFVLFAHDAAR